MDLSKDKTLPHRIAALVDGIFAIVMTILVLDIKVPQDLASYKEISVEYFLTGHFQDIIVYMIVFITLGYLWFVHHSLSRHVEHADRGYLWLNIFTVMFVGLIPFTSSLVNKFPKDWVAELFLSSNMFVIGVFNYFAWIYATKKHRLISEEISAIFIRAEKARLLIFPMVSMAAMATSFLQPVFTLYVLLLAPIVVFLSRLARNLY